MSRSNCDVLGDNISDVELISYMGDDIRVVNAARVSMDKESKLGLTGDVSSDDQALLKYLAKHKHWTPFSHVMFTFRIKMPIYIARHWYKHQIGFTRNEMSRRYVDSAPEYHIVKEWRQRAENVKQGSSEQLAYLSLETLDDLDFALNEIDSLYHRLLDAGVAPELARTILPQSMYTEFYETASLAAYARLCGLRTDSHAQVEVRKYAQAISDMIDPLVPHSWRQQTHV